MSRSGRSFVLAVAAALACAAPAAAQGRLRDYSIGARVLVAQPEGYRPQGLGAGAGFGFDVGYQASPGVMLYAGFSRIEFPVEEEAEQADWVDSGIDLGVQVTVPEGGVQAWLRGGVVVHELEANYGMRVKGLEGGAGLALRLGRHVTLLPGVVYTTYLLVPSGVPHLRAEVGLRLRP